MVDKTLWHIAKKGKFIDVKYRCERYESNLKIIDTIVFDNIWDAHDRCKELNAPIENRRAKKMQISAT